MRFEALSPVRIAASCTSCYVAGYETFNPFHCPHCRKLNQPRTAGHILAVRAIASA